MNTISERALMKRINRRLPEFQQVHKSRGARWARHLGEFYVLDHRKHRLAQTHVDLDDLGRDVGAITDEQ